MLLSRIRNIFASVYMYVSVYHTGALILVSWAASCLQQTMQPVIVV